MKDTKNFSHLTKDEYNVLRNKDTEAAFSGDLLHNKDTGMYMCKACGQELFSSEKKYDSGSGWPSFSNVVNEGNVVLEEDKTLGMSRTEVICSNCGSHLGHVFEDGPREDTGLRYCINSAALDFENGKEKGEDM